MTLLYDHSIFLEHETGEHPECAGRIVPIRKRLEQPAPEFRIEPVTWQATEPLDLARVHDVDYVERVAEFAEEGGGRIEADTVVSPRSYEVALMAAGAVCDAVERVINGDDQRAFCLVRPPGHHALKNNPMGFCLFNNVAVGARLATRKRGLDRVLIVDWDVHHGNGTQDAFWDDPQVGFYSMHRWPFYPGTGDKYETGQGKALGTTRNVPIEFGRSRKDILSEFATTLSEFAAKIRPQLVLISAGFDAHRSDPIGSLGLESEDFRSLTQTVIEIADQYAEGKVVSVLEGGYHPAALAESIEVHLTELSSKRD